MRLHRVALSAASLLLLSSVPALPQQTAQPQFQSSEVKVTVNRARRNAAGQLSVTLLFSNISQEAAPRWLPILATPPCPQTP